MDNITQTLMRGAGSGSGSTVPTDPNFNQVALLLHGDGTNGSQNNTFVDSSTNNFSITRNGNATQGSFSPFAPTGAYSPSVNGGSGYFDGNGGSTSNTDRLDIANNSALQFGSSDFTAETWFYLTAAPTVSFLRILDKGSTSTSNAEYLLTINSTTQGSFQYSSNGTTLTSVTFTSTFTVGAWHHLAVTRSGTTLTIWHNGSSIATATINVTLFAGAATLYIGNRAGNDRTFSGYLSNLRIVNGTAVYTSTFTPPTAPLTDITNTSLLLNFTNAGIVDSSAKFDIETVGNAQISTSVTKYGTGSLEFDGTGDGLKATGISVLPSGSEAYTIEFWMWLNNNSSIMTPVTYGTRVTNSSTTIQIRPSGVVRLSNFNNDIESPTSSFTANTWHHIVGQYDGTTRRIFVDGVQVAADTTTAVNVAATDVCLVGVSLATTNYFNGYIDDLRITKGVARYTSAGFTPPTAPYPDL